MVDLSEFESISPYTDAEAAEALSKLAEYPLLAGVSQQFFPEESPDFLKNLLKSIKTIDEFQVLVKKQHGVEIDKRDIKCENIRTVGDVDIEVRVYKDISAKMTVHVEGVAAK